MFLFFSNSVHCTTFLAEPRMGPKERLLLVALPKGDSCLFHRRIKVTNSSLNSWFREKKSFLQSRPSHNQMQVSGHARRLWVCQSGFPQIGATHRLQNSLKKRLHRTQCSRAYANMHYVAAFSQFRHLTKQILAGTSNKVVATIRDSMSPAQVISLMS